MLNFDKDYPQNVLRYLLLTTMGDFLLNPTQKLQIFNSCEPFLLDLLETDQGLSIEILFRISELNFSFFGATQESFMLVLENYFEKIDTDALELKDSIVLLEALKNFKFSHRGFKRDLMDRTLTPYFYRKIGEFCDAHKRLVYQDNSSNNYIENLMAQLNNLDSQEILDFELMKKDFYAHEMNEIL